MLAACSSPLIGTQRRTILGAWAASTPIPRKSVELVNVIPVHGRHLFERAGSADFCGKRKPRVCLCRVPAILPEPARGKPRVCVGGSAHSGKFTGKSLHRVREFARTVIPVGQNSSQLANVIPVCARVAQATRSKMIGYKMCSPCVGGIASRRREP